MTSAIVADAKAKMIIASVKSRMAWVMWLSRGPVAVAGNGTLALPLGASLGNDVGNHNSHIRLDTSHDGVNRFRSLLASGL